jgi:hypothetical protein
MVKFPSITLAHKESYIVIANAMLNVGLPGTYIVHAKGNPQTLFKLMESEGLFNYAFYYQLENFEILKNHGTKIQTKDGLNLYKYIRNK